MASRFSLCLFQCSSMVRTRIKSRAVPVLVTKVIFENPLNWTTRSFIFAKQGEYEYGRPTPEPSGELSCEGPYLAKLAESSMKMVISTNSRRFIQVAPIDNFRVADDSG